MSQPRIEIDSDGMPCDTEVRVDGRQAAYKRLELIFVAGECTRARIELADGTIVEGVVWMSQFTAEPAVEVIVR